MAASTIAGIMSGIGTNLKTISGLNVAAYVSDQVNPPQAVVAVPPIAAYREAFGRAKFLLEVPVYILVSATIDYVGQAALAGFADVTGANSIPVAIESDRTLGGVVDDAIVWSFAPLTQEEVNAISYFGGIFTVRVIARGV